MQLLFLIATQYLEIGRSRLRQDNTILHGNPVIHLRFKPGVVLAILSWSSRAFSALASPVALLLSSTPVVCLIPLLARIFGYNSRTELAIVVLLTFFPAFVYSARGLRKLPPMSNQYFKSLAAGRSRQLWLLAFPAAAPSIATALRICSALSILVTVVAEYLMQNGGLGNMFALTSQAFETDARSKRASWRWSCRVCLISLPGQWNGGSSRFADETLQILLVFHLLDHQRTAPRSLPPVAKNKQLATRWFSDQGTALFINVRLQIS